MWYIREGLLCLESAEGAQELFDVEQGKREHLTPAQYQAAVELLDGLDDDKAHGAIELLGNDAVEKRDTPFDAVIEKHLAKQDESFTWMLPEKSRVLLPLCEKAHSLLRHWRQDLDQLPVLPETALRRALVLRQLADGPARVAMVGDDDLVAVPAAALGLRPMVFDIDDTLLAAHRRLGRTFGLSIETVCHDLKQPLPQEAVHAFDLFCTDPETSRECISLFLSRAVTLCRPGGQGIIACAEEWEPLLTEARESMTLERRALYRRFNNYRDGTLALAAYRSDLHCLALGKETKPLVAPEETFRDELFPFGLSGGDHLVARARGCNPDAAAGPALDTVLAEFLGREDFHLEDRHPLPVRIVVATSARGRAQATVHADGRTVDIDVTPWTEEEDSRPLATGLVELLGAQETRLRCLRRLE